MLSYPSTLDYFWSFLCSINKNWLRSFGIGPRYLHLRIDIIQIPLKWLAVQSFSQFYTVSNISIVPHP